MNQITIKYIVNSEIIDNPANENLFTLSILENIKEVYDRILEQLTPIDIEIDRNTEDQTKIAIKITCSISKRGADVNFNVDDLINKALRSKDL